MLVYLCVSGDFTQVIEVNLINDCITAIPNGYVMQSAQTLTDQPTLKDIFTIPVASDLLQMWELGVGLPILCYLAAWGYGTIIDMFNRNQT